MTQEAIRNTRIIAIQSLVEKLVSELNAQMDDGSQMVELYSDDVEEINQTIKDLGIKGVHLHE